MLKSSESDTSDQVELDPFDEQGTPSAAEENFSQLVSNDVEVVRSPFDTETSGATPSPQDLKDSLRTLLEERGKLSPQVRRYAERLGKISESSSEACAQALISEVIKIARTLAREEDRAESLVRALEVQVFEQSLTPKAVRDIIDTVSSFAGDPVVLKTLVENITGEFKEALQRLEYHFVASEDGVEMVCHSKSHDNESTFSLPVDSSTDVRALILEEHDSPLSLEDALSSFLADAPERTIGELIEGLEQVSEQISSGGNHELLSRIQSDLQCLTRVAKCLPLVDRSSFPRMASATDVVRSQVNALKELDPYLHAALLNHVDPSIDSSDVEIPASVLRSGLLAEKLLSLPLSRELVEGSIRDDLMQYKAYFSQCGGESSVCQQHGSPEILEAELSNILAAIAEDPTLKTLDAMNEEVEQLLSIRARANKNLLAHYGAEFDESLGMLRASVQSNEGERLFVEVPEALSLERVSPRLRNHFLSREELSPVLKWLDAESRLGEHYSSRSLSPEFLMQFSIPEFVEVVESIVVSGRKVSAELSSKRGGHSSQFDPNEHYRPIEELSEFSQLGEDPLIMRKVESLAACDRLLGAAEGKVLQSAVRSHSWRILTTGLFADADYEVLTNAARIAEGTRWIDPSEFGETIELAEACLGSVLFPKQESSHVILGQPYPREVLPILRALATFYRDIQASEALFDKRIESFQECFEQYRDGKGFSDIPLFVSLEQSGPGGGAVPRLIGFDQIPGMLLPVNFSITRDERFTLFSYNPLRITAFQSEVNNGKWISGSAIGPRFFQGVREVLSSPEYEALLALGSAKQLESKGRMGKLDHHQFAHFLLDCDAERLRSVFIHESFSHFIDAILRRQRRRVA